MVIKMKKENIRSVVRFIKRLVKERQKYLVIYILGFITGIIFLLSIISIFIPSKKFLINNPLVTISFIVISLLINIVMFSLFIKYQKIVAFLEKS